MKKFFKNYFWLILIFALAFFTACGEKAVSNEPINIDADIQIEDISEDGIYYEKSEVANYIKTFGKLPKNYIKKSDAKKLGWIPEEGNLQEVFENGVIGGDRFGNREGLLPKGKEYFECDVNYTGGRRGPERLVFTEDGDIYYTPDHYESFEELK